VAGREGMGQNREDQDNFWRIYVTGRARKQREKLPQDIKAALDLLEFELATEGPERRNWPHYGKVFGKKKNLDMRHYHLNQNRPCYVAVWVVTDQRAKLMEIRYVGTHENADYGRIN
jgi:hypothetical protein